MSTPDTRHRVIPPSRGGDGRTRKRRPPVGLSVVCTKPLIARTGAAPRRNLALELRDVGWGGIRFESAEPLPVPCKLDIQIRQVETGEVFNGRGEVAWTRTIKVDGKTRHVVGVRFGEILTPASKCARIFDGPMPAPRVGEATPPGAAAAPSPSTGTVRRVGDRFPVERVDVTLIRKGGWRLFGRRPNLAIRIIDLSRSGVAVACTEPLAVGAVLDFTMLVLKFGDTFATPATVVRAGRPLAGEDGAWAVALEFGELGRSQKMLLESLERWFAYTSNSSPHPPKA